MFKDLSGQLDRQLAALTALINGELAEFNKGLAREKLPPVAARK